MRNRSGTYRLFVFLLLFTPLAFGTVEKWSYAVMETMAVLLLVTVLLNKNQPLYTPRGIVFVLLLWFYMIFQALPLYSRIVEVLSPERYRIFKETLAITGLRQWPSLSFFKKATLEEVFRFVGYGAFYLVSVQVLSDRVQKERLLKTLAWFFSLLAFFSIIQNILSAEAIYWYRKPPEGASFFGPFVNRNHYAFFMGIFFPTMVAMLIYYRPTITQKSQIKGLKEFVIDRRFNTYTLLVLGCTVVATSVFLSLSRGGIVSLCVAMMVFGLLYSVSEKDRKGSVIFMVALLVVLAVGWFGWSPIIERFGQLGIMQAEIRDLRVQIWNDSLRIIKDYFLTGTGFGTYVRVYPLYRTIGGTKIVDHAHNEYIEMLAEGGIVGTVLFLMFLSSVLVFGIKNLRRKRSRFSRLITIGAVSGLIGALVHNAVDFNLQIGANGLYFFFTLALIVATANTRELKIKTFYSNKITVALCGVILALTFLFNAGINLAKLFAYAEPSKDEETLSIERRLRMASILDPFDGYYPFRLAEIQIKRGRYSEGKGYLKQAVLLDPLNTGYLNLLGQLYAEMGMKYLAERTLKHAIHLSPGSPELYESLARYYILTGKKSQALEEIKKAISLNPADTGRYITLLLLYGYEDSEILEAIPELTGPFLVMARYLLSTGNNALAARAFEMAEQYLDRTSPVSFFLKIAEFYIQKNDFQRAINVLEKGLRSSPESISLRLKLAYAYEATGINYRAKEEYRRVLQIQPDNRRAKEALKRLMVM